MIVAGRGPLVIPVIGTSWSAVRIPVGMIPEELETVARDLEPLPAEILRKLGIQLGDQVGVEGGGQVVDLPGAQASEVIVLVASRIEARAGIAVAGGELGRHADGHQSLERLVDGGETNLGDDRPDGVIDLLGRGVVIRPAQMVVDGQPLGRATQAGLLQTRAYGLMIKRGGPHDSRSPFLISGSA
jgi:hypothetical protein